MSQPAHLARALARCAGWLIALLMLCDSSMSWAQAPALEFADAAQFGEAGKKIEFKVVEQGQNKLEKDKDYDFTWYVNDQLIPGEDKVKLKLKDLSDVDEGTYRVEVVHTATQTTYTVLGTLDVQQPPKIEREPEEWEVLTGDCVIYSVEASGDALRYEWTLGNQIVSTSPHLIIDSVDASHAGKIDVKVWNDADTKGDKAKGKITLLGQPPNGSALGNPADDLYLEPATQTIPQGQSALIELLKYGGNPPTGPPWSHLWWLADGSTLTDQTSLFIPSVIPSDSRTYYHVISRKRGKGADAECRRAQLEVYAPPVIVQSPPDTLLMEGDGFTFMVDAQGTDLEYTWTLDGQLVSNTDTWVLTSAALSDAGVVHIKVSSAFDPAGVSASFALDVYPFIPNGPELVALPTPQYVATGDDVRITASTSANHEPYLWEWIDALGQTVSTSPDLVLPAITTPLAGLYTVRVTGQTSGQFDDAQVELIVQDPARIDDTLGTLVGVGETAFLTVLASGTDLEILWERGGQIVGMGPQLVLGNAQLADAGNYEVTVRNVVTQPGVTAQVELRVLEPVQILTPPADVTLATGASTTLSVQATGSEPSYAWTFQGQPLGTAPDVTLPALQPSQSGVYTVRVYNDLDPMGQSASATIDVLDPPVITQGPVDITVTEGDAFTAEVLATGTNLEYAWMLDGQVVSTQSTWGVGSASVSQQGPVTVTVSNAVDTAGQSASFTLTVNPDIPSGPTLDALTSPEYVRAGEGVSLTASIPQTYEPYSWSWTDAQGQVLSTTPTLALTGLTSSQAYTVTVTGDISSLSDQAIVQVIVQEPAVITSTQGATVSTGATATLTVDATGTDLTYTWQKQGQVVGSTSTLTLSTTRLADAGDYTITVSNEVTQPGVTQTVTLSVLEPVQITTPPTDQIVATGSSASFGVVATGSQLVYTWQRDGQSLAQAASLTLNTVSKSDSGSYTVTVTNPVDPTGQSASATLTVLDPPAITTQPTPSVTIAKGQGFSLTVAATGDDLSYQWLRDGSEVSGATSNAYTVSGAQINQSGSYTVRVSNAISQAISTPSTVLVEDIESVQIITQPLDQAVSPNTSVTFEVTATGDEIAYQWLREGAEISGATASTYALLATLADDGALFGVRVSNRYSEELSQTALLRVQDTQPPTLTLDDPGTVLTFDETLAVTGTVQDDISAQEAIELLVITDRLAGVEFSDFADASGGFRIDVPLEIGSNLISVRAQDGEGNTTSPAQTLTIERRAAVTPEIALRQPNRDIQTLASTIDVRGDVRTSLASTAFTVSVNGQAVTVTSAGQDAYEFELEGVALVQGPNLIEAVVTSAQGSARAQAVVERLPDDGGGGTPTIDVTLGSTQAELWLSEQTYTLAGSVSASDCVTLVTVNGATPVTLDGMFSPQVNFSTTVTVPTTDGTAFPVMVEATGCGGQVITKELILRVDLDAPVVALDEVLSSGVNVVLSNPYRLTGTISDAFIAGAMLNGQPLAIVPGATQGEWTFAADLTLERAVESEVTIAAWDLGGNRTETSATLRLDTAVSLRTVMPLDGEQVLVDGEQGPVRIRAVASQTNATDRVQVRVDEGSFIPLTRVDEAYEGELTLDAGESYTAELQVVDAQGDVLASAQVSFDVLNEQRVAAELIDSDPEADETLVETNVPVRLTFNRALDPSRVFIVARETVHQYVYDKNYDNADLRDLSNITRTLISHERQVVPGSLQNLPGNRTYVFYPEREWTYGATLYLEVYYDNAEVGRMSFRTREAPTLVHGFVRSVSGLPLRGVRVELGDTGEAAITGDDGEYQFGWGWDARRTVPSGQMLLRVNMGDDALDYAGVEILTPVIKGEINSMPNATLAPVLQAQSSSLLQAGQVVQLDDTNLEIDLTQISTISQGTRQGQAVANTTLTDLGATGYPVTAPTLGGVVFTLAPAGISLEGKLSMTMALPLIDGAPDYLQGAYQTLTTPPSVWVIGLDEPSRTLKVKGIATIDVTQTVATSTELMSFERLDVIGIAFITPAHYALVDQYHQNQLTLDALLQALEAGQ